MLLRSTLVHSFSLGRSYFLLGGAKPIFKQHAHVDRAGNCEMNQQQ